MDGNENETAGSVIFGIASFFAWRYIAALPVGLSYSIFSKKGKPRERFKKAFS